MRYTTVVTIEKRIAALRAEADKLQSAIDTIKEYERPVREKQVAAKVNGALSAFVRKRRRPRKQAQDTNAGKRPPGERAIDAVMRTLVAAPGPLTTQELRTRMAGFPAKVVGSTFSTGVRYGRLRSTADGWVITAKGRKEIAQLNGAHP